MHSKEITKVTISIALISQNNPKDVVLLEFVNKISKDAPFMVKLSILKSRIMAMTFLYIRGVIRILRPGSNGGWFE